MRVALWIAAGAVVAGWLTLVALHLRDDYRVGHVQGVWIAAAEDARAGQWYPPLFDGEHYAGTRYMPLPILLNALAAGIVGDPWVGGKLLAALLTAILLVLIIYVSRRCSCDWALAIALPAAVVATDVGLQAGTTTGGDVLPVVLQLGAVAVAMRGRDRSTMMIAGGLAGLAMASKLTGIWGLMAIATWLAAQRQWRPAMVFAGASVGTAAVILGAVQLATRGGLSQHLLAFSIAGVHGGFSVFRAPNQVLYNLLGHASATVVLLPLAVVGALLSTGWRHLSVIHFALGYSLLLLLVVYTDIGTGSNQLLDLAVLIALAFGHLAGRAASLDPRLRQTVALAMMVTVLWATSLDLVRTVGFDLRGAVAVLESGQPAVRAATAVANIARPDEQVLAEDPSIYVALGRRPLIMDPFMLARLDRSHPEWIDPLVSKIVDRRFDLVVLAVPLENRSLDYWWTDYHFGPRVAGALRKSYKLDRSVGRYFLYRPTS
jgi:Glycosyltransferase family 87